MKKQRKLSQFARISLTTVSATIVLTSLFWGSGCGGNEGVCEDGPQECLNHGVTLQNIGGAENNQKALSMFEEICRSQDETALEGCTLAAHIYRKGKQGVARDLRKAVSLYEKSCDLDQQATLNSVHQLPVGYACFHLGNLYGLGEEGIPVQTEKSHSYLTEACRQGVSEACNFAKMLENSIGEKSTGAIVARCNNGNAEDCAEAGHRYWKGRNGTEKNVQLGHSYLQKSCDQGHGLGCVALGMMYEDGALGGSPNYQKAADSFRTGCEKGSNLGCGRIGNWLLNGKHISKNPRQGVSYLQKACDGNDRSGCTWLAIAYKNGWGVRKNRRNSTKYLNKACKLGEKIACNALSRR